MPPAISPSATRDTEPVPRRLQHAMKATPAPVRLSTIAREWGRIGCIGFGGPPAHISLLRKLCVNDNGWISPNEFEDAIAATNLLPGPASTQLAIFCGWRLRGWAGAVVGGLCFITPGLAVILVLAAVFLAGHPALWVTGAAAGAGSAVAAVALNAALGLVPASWQRVRGAAPLATGEGKARPAARQGSRARWVGYAVAGAASAGSLGPYLVLVLLVAGLTEMTLRSLPLVPGRRGAAGFAPWLATIAPVGGLGAVAWVALKVGALSYGGGFVIVPLMQSDAVHHYHWMTAAQFLNAVALGQVTPGPVVQTVAVVGYAADKLAGGLLAAAIAFAPSFLFVLVGGRHFDSLRSNLMVQSFLAGAGPAAIGAIAGSAVPLALALAHLWQVGVLAAAAIWVVVLRRSVVAVIVAAGATGVLAALAGLPLS
jgi:chromate transporter